MTDKAPEQLTAQEAAIYDRQLRIWGVETQQRLSAARVLIAGCTGLAAEVAKNIVLAGVGCVMLVDDTPCSHRPLSNFLIAGDAAPDTTCAPAAPSATNECAAALLHMLLANGMLCCPASVPTAHAYLLHGCVRKPLVCTASVCIASGCTASVCIASGNPAMPP